MTSHDPHSSTAFPHLYSYSSTQSSPRPIEDNTAPVSTDVVRGYQDHRSIVTPHPILGMIAMTLPNGTVVVCGPPLYRVETNGPAWYEEPFNYHIGPNGPERCEEPLHCHVGPGAPEFPLLLHEDSRVKVPQHPYACGNTQKDWQPKPTILFYTDDRLGVKVTDGFAGRFNGIKDRDDFPFEDCRGITIRMHFLGYKSSTEVEKELKRSVEGRKGTKARSMQLSTKNYKVPPEPVTKSKLIQEVSKRIKWHITDLETNSSLFPFNGHVDEQWRLGHGRMTFERMVVTGLANVSFGSWSPIIYLE